jgi:hypothetical protein
MKRPVKSKTVQVRLNPRDWAALTKAARLESEQRHEIVGESTLVREIVMPVVRDRLAAAGQVAA